MRKMRQKNHGFMLEIWLKVDHFLTQNLASRENINFLSHPCVAWAGWFGQEKKIRQLNAYQCVATHQKHKKSREHNSISIFAFVIIVWFSLSI